MRVGELCDRLFELYPRSLAADFDNVGLLVGDPDEEIRAAVVSLDCTDLALEEAVSRGANLIITHHPVIFGGLKSVTVDSPVWHLVKNGISVISMHTNLDSADGGVNDALAEKIGLTKVKKAELGGVTIRLGELAEPVGADKLAETVGSRLSCMVRFCLLQKEVRTVAVCSGAGGELLDEVARLGVDAFLTAEVKHHRFIEATRSGIALFDCGHFETEDIIVGVLARKTAELAGCPVFENHMSGICNI